MTLKLRSEQKELHAAIAAVAHTVPNRPVHPILAGIMLETVDGQLTASAFDYEVSATSSIAVDAPDARILVPGRYLVDLLGRMPAGPVELVSDGRNLTITAGRAKATIPLLPIDDYPALPAMPPLLGTVDGEALAAALKHGGQAVDPGGLSSICGVRIQSADDILEVTATDRYRIHTFSLPWAGEDVAATIPLPSLKAAAALDDGQVRLHGDESTIALATATRTSSTRLIADEYVKWRSLLPTPKHEVTVDAAALIDALKRTAAVNERSLPVTLAFVDGTLHVDSGTAEGPSTSEDLEYEGSLRLPLRFNAAYLLDVLAPIAGRVRLGITDATKVVMFTAEPADTYRGLLMPVRPA